MFNFFVYLYPCYVLIINCKMNRPRRKLTEPASMARKQKKRKRLPRKAKKEPTLDFCAINGTKNCTPEKKVPMAEMDSCECKKMCVPCARMWFKTSSTCCFCRKTVSMVNNSDVTFVRQREDHDQDVPSFSFPYRNWIGQLDIFHAHLFQSQLFANSRATLKLPKEILFMIKTIDNLNEDVLHDNAYFCLLNQKIYSFRGKRRQAIYRILFYFTLEKRNPIAMFFLCTLLRRAVNDKERNHKKKLFDLRDESYLKISKAIFHDVPEKSLFEKSCFTILQENSGTRHWFILTNILPYLFPGEAKNFELDITEAYEEEEEEIDFFDTVILTTTI